MAANQALMNELAAVKADIMKHVTSPTESTTPSPRVAAPTPKATQPATPPASRRAPVAPAKAPSREDTTRESADEDEASFFLISETHIVV